LFIVVVQFAAGTQWTG